jgi:glycosyl transferase, family 25
MLQSVDCGGLLQHVPKVEIIGGGHCMQAAGVELPIAVINLNHRPDRMETLSTRMAPIGLNRLIRAPAVNGRELSANQIRAFLGAAVSTIDDAPRSHLTLTRPAIGCFMSHLAVWRWVIANNMPRVLVFEDDAVPGVNFDPARFRAVLASIPESAGLVFFGSIIMNGLAEEATDGEFARLYYFNGTFAYLITPSACRSLIFHLGRPHWHIDHQISKVLFEHRHNFAALRTVPHFFEPDWTLRSDCYVPLTEESDADVELGALLDRRRRQLLAEGRPLLAPHV